MLKRPSNDANRRGAGESSDIALYRRLILEARQFWPHIAGLFALGLLSAPLTLLSPLPLKIVVDSVLGSHNLPGWLAFFLPVDAKSSDVSAVVLVAVLIILLALAKHVVDLFFVLLRTYTAERLVLAFRARLFGHLQRLSLSYHDSSSTANSIYRIQYDAPAIQWIMIDAFIPLISSLVTLAFMIIVMARIDWSLAGVALTVVPIIYVLTRVYGRRLKSQWRQAKDLENSTLSVAEQAISLVRIVKVFAQEEREQQRYLQNAQRSLREQVRLSLTSGSFGLIVGSFGTISCSSCNRLVTAPLPNMVMPVALPPGRLRLRYQAILDGVAGGSEHYWNCLGCCLGGLRRRFAPGGGDDGDLSAYQIGRKVGQPIVIALRPAVFDPAHSGPRPSRLP